ncbi:MAG: hypothetical protein DYG89_49725 [Caldilinea sp. CFX5]|nr:hypothetical protein [Caldilinea sp. CFX5]
MKNWYQFFCVRQDQLASALVSAGNPVDNGRWSLFAQQQDDDVVRARRRRPTTPTAPGEREQADAPRRRRDEGNLPPSGGGPGKPTGGGPLPGGGQLPGGCGGILIVLLLILVAVFGGPNLLNQGGGQDDGSNQPVVQEPPLVANTDEPTEAEATPTEEVQVAPAEPTKAAAQPAATATKRAANQAAASASGNAGATKGQRWTVLLYQDADDKVLEKDIYVDLNEAERVGSTDRVNIVAQIDRFRGGFAGDGDWVSAKRFYVTKDNDLETLGSQEVADLGEINMADPRTLIDFVTWGVKNYPADKYVLILSDHGLGWPGGWNDASSAATASPNRNIPIAEALGNAMYLMDIDKALGQIRQQSGVDKFEILGMDACLMAHLEVFTALEPHGRYAVASQETEPALGWAYTSFLGALTSNPDSSGAELSKLIVQSYIQNDQRILDDNQRAELVSRGSTLGGIFGILTAPAVPSAAEVASEMGQNITLTAFDLAKTAALNAAVNKLVTGLQEVDQRAVAQARSHTQSYTSIFGPEVPASYIDLGHFTRILQQMGASGDLAQAIAAVQSALKGAVIAEKHGRNKPGSTGVSIYYPISQLYRSPVAGPVSYTAVAKRFADASLWDDFLLFHYTGRNFEPTAQRAAVPERGVAVRGPGAGQIDVGPLTLSADSAAPGQPVLMRTEVTGENVGYIYIFAGFYDQASNAIFVADTDYLESSDTQEVDGVYYPTWPTDGQFTLEFEWEPLMFAISDGTTSETALFQPQTYGAAREETTYTVDGIYTFVENGATLAARLYFRDGLLRQVFGFTHPDQTGAPREITPEQGDTFTILEHWMDLDQRGRVTQTVRQPGGVLTFGEEPFTWQEQNAASGDYVIGFIVKDLDGNATEAYAQVNVP